jgi:hypothetical protein
MIQIPVSKENKVALVKWANIKVTPDLTKFNDYRLANIQVRLII